MNRQIKFRGKRKDSGEWVRGGITVNDNRCFITLCTGYKLKYIPKLIGIEVIPETVGQFTGLCDGNGKEIYDGDILGAKGIIIGHVKDGVRGYCYDVVYAMPLRERGCSLYHTVKYDYPNRIEVVGNIHDNRDLLTAK
jgi:uncharacterized phage protein (TIGR01671 family)